MIGLFGGTFNPLHFAHLNLAIQMLERCGLEEIWFCPVQISPHKVAEPPISVQHRYKMLELVIPNIPGCKLIDIEINRPGPSYTIETIEKLKQIAPNKKFALILGEDAIPSFVNWHQPEKIIDEVKLLIGKRANANYNFDDIKGPIKMRQALSEGLVDTPIIEISSTEVRKRLSLGLFCGHLVPEKILDYIKKNKLYYSGKQ